MGAPAEYRERLELMDRGRLARTLARMAHEVAERHPDLRNVVLVGVRTRGVILHGRLEGAPAGLPEATASDLGLIPAPGSARSSRLRPAKPGRNGMATSNSLPRTVMSILAISGLLLGSLLVVRPFIVYYRVEQRTSSVHVLHVIHGKRRQPKFPAVAC